MSSVVGVSEIAKILCNDDLLLKDKTTFAIALRIPTGTRKQLEDQFAMFVSSAQDYFIKVDLFVFNFNAQEYEMNIIFLFNALDFGNLDKKHITHVAKPSGNIKRKRVYVCIM